MTLLTPSDIITKTPVEALPSLQGTLATFMGTTLEFAQFCNDQFNEETSFKGVQRRLAGMLADWFGLEEVSYLTLETARGVTELKRWPTRFPPVPPISENAIGSVRAALQAVVSGEDEVRQGYYAIFAAGADYLCAQFDEPASQRGVLVWRLSDSAKLTRGALVLSNAPASTDIIDYMVRSAQKTSQWLRRLDNTQALLYQDEVTGLYNYRYLDVALDAEIKRHQRFYLPFSLLFIDLDNFKQVNDVHGHMTGSSVLRQAGEQIKAAVRDVDSVIRYGGDEFVVVLLGANSFQAWMAAERVRNRVDGCQFQADGKDVKIHITTSIGVACCPEHTQDKATIIRLADETMYAAKNSGKNRVIMVQGKDPHPTPTIRRMIP